MADARQAWGYARVSTKKQSCYMQQHAIASWCSENNYPLRGVFEDFGYSGALSPSGRPGLSELLEKVRDGDAVVFFAQDRLSRHADVTHQIMALLEGRNIELVDISVATQGSSPEARLMAGIIDQLELCESCHVKATMLVLGVAMHNGKTVP